MCPAPPRCTDAGGEVEIPQVMLMYKPGWKALSFTVFLGGSKNVGPELDPWARKLTRVWPLVPVLH